MALITTTKGLMPSEALRRVDCPPIDNENEFTTAVEYYDGDELVHRSAHVHIKRPLTLSGALEPFHGE